MRTEVRQSRLARLRSAQNTDGGWGYFPGKQSWLEPTCYSLLALYKDPASTEAWTRGWSLVRSWQQPDGAFRPANAVAKSSWATALMVSLHCVHGVHDSTFERAVAWMLGVKGTEGHWVERAYNAVLPLPVEYDRRWRGWPWSPDSSSWIEPTSHSMVALKKASSRVATSLLSERLIEAERMILDRRCPDGGWNYGNRRVLRTDLPSYAETTAIALLGLQGSRSLDLNRTLDAAQKQWAATRSRLARAWLTIALRNYGRTLPEPVEEPADTGDLMLTALEALACANGGHQWFKAV